MCDARGWMTRVEPYCGSHTNLPDYDLGQGPNVVLGLVEAAEVPPGGKIYFDNLFTSLPLLDKLSEKGIGGTGTLRQNRLGPIPLPKKKEVEKNFARGEMEVYYCYYCYYFSYFYYPPLFRWYMLKIKWLWPGWTTRQFTLPATLTQ